MIESEVLRYFITEWWPAWILWIVLIIIMKDWRKRDELIRKQLIEWLTDIRLSIWKHTPPSKQAIIDIASKFVRSACSAKLAFIEDRLEKNNIKERRSRIESQIKAELEKISQDQYITPLNCYNTKVWPLWDWVSDKFPMNDFLDEVYEVVFREDWDIKAKLKDIETLMRWYQNELWALLKDLL